MRQKHIQANRMSSYLGDPPKNEEKESVRKKKHLIKAVLLLRNSLFVSINKLGLQTTARKLRMSPLLTGHNPVHCFSCSASFLGHLLVVDSSIDIDSHC